VGERDREIVAQQLGRAPRAFRRVAVRCPFGRPAVTEQAPFDEDGKPFPTEFWVTCPHLVAQLARVEAGGGVERWTRAAAEEPRLARSLADAQAQQRALRPELPLGIGGSSRGGSPKAAPVDADRKRLRGSPVQPLKCLHAHAGFALARPGYELGDLILADAAPLWPSTGCCT
jgi:hypothetical protein